MTKPDIFHQHEALHMSLFLAESVERQLIENAFVASDHECMALANKANEILLDLYQLIGEKNLAENND